jgi:hypothetical protein
MSITFFPATTEGRPLLRCTCDLEGPAALLMTCARCKSEVNLCNANAFDLLQWLGLTPASLGDFPARELAARCRRRLWDEARNHDPALAADDRLAALGGPAGGAQVVMQDRRPGYLRHQTERLLAVAQAAGDGLVCWG